MAVHSVSIDFEGRKYTLESGKLAKFSNGAVMVSCWDNGKGVGKKRWFSSRMVW